MTDANHIAEFHLDKTGLPTPSVVIGQEWDVAIFDLLEENSFALPETAGPYKLNLSIRERRLVFDVRTEDNVRAAEFHLSLTPFSQVIKDYFQICASYYDAVKSLPPSQIEAIDMGRRGIHNEGGRILLERLEGKAVTDMATARRLFTLISALHFKG